MPCFRPLVYLPTVGLGGHSTITGLGNYVARPRTWLTCGGGPLGVCAQTSGCHVSSGTAVGHLWRDHSRGPCPPSGGDPLTAALAVAVHLRSARLPRSAPGRPGPPTTPVTPAAQPPTPCPPPLRLPPPPPPCSLPRLPHRHPAQQSCALAPPSRPPACLPLPWGTVGPIHTYSSPAQFCCAPRLPVGGTTCSVPKQRCAVHLSGLDK